MAVSINERDCALPFNARYNFNGYDVILKNLFQLIIHIYGPVQASITDIGPLFLTWNNFNPNMDRQSHAR